MKKIYSLFIVCLILIMPSVAQNVAINEDGSLPHPKAILDVKSTNKGILIPRISTSDRVAMRATKGLLVYDTTTSSFWYFGYPYNVDTIDPVYWREVATGSNWSLQGNYIENAKLGTINDKPLKIVVNGLLSGEINKTRKNTFWGFTAGYRNSTASDTMGNDNTAVGFSSLSVTGSGNHNSALGSNTLYANTSGSFNTASGVYSLYNNTRGSFNTANGLRSLNENTTGMYNTASGVYSLYNNATGFYNTAVGYEALWGNVSGWYNTAIGTGANVSATVSNATAIGYGATVNASNKVRIGNSAVTVIEGQVPFTVPSDGRFKFEVKEDVKGLDFILQLRPVTYPFDVKRFQAQTSQPVNNKENTAEYPIMQAAYNEAAAIRRSGFIAQEVEKAALASGYNFSGIIQPKTTQEHYSLSYESFVVPLVKAVQELNKEAASQQQIIAEQNKKIELQDKKLAALQQQLDNIKQLLPGSK
jgi:hypothetical protein